MSPDNCARLINHLHTQRRQRGISRPELVAAIGCVPTQLWAWETGAVTPSLPYFTAWAAALGYRLHLDDTPAVHTAPAVAGPAGMCLCSHHHTGRCPAPLCGCREHRPQGGTA